MTPITAAAIRRARDLIVARRTITSPTAPDADVLKSRPRSSGCESRSNGCGSGSRRRIGWRRLLGDTGKNGAMAA